MQRRAIFVESRIRTPIDRLWEATQDPAQHQRWDLRFGRIDPPTDPEEMPRRFTYATKVFPGVEVSGVGESIGDRDRPDGSHWSGLKFWSDDRRSIIGSGAGYWRYVPDGDSVRFLTGYNYEPKWGAVGSAVDRWLFRPVFGWATAWSFDRLRLWLEEGTPPEVSRNLAIAHTTASLGIAAVWGYQGLVPKMLNFDQGELDFWLNLGLASGAARAAVFASGLAEVVFGLLVWVFRRQRWPFVITLVAMAALGVGAALTNAAVLGQAFNPVGVNLAMAALAGVGLATRTGRPDARRTLRTPPDDEAEELS